MDPKRTVLAILLAFLAINPCRAATLLQTDFGQGDQGWVRRGSARLAITGEPSRNQVLRLTSSRNSQVGVAWTELRRRVPSFSFIVDARIQFTPRYEGDCPADGFALVFAPVQTDAIGGAGGSLGLCNSEFEIRQFVALEINTWSGQGLGTDAERADCASGMNETFAFDVLRPEMSRTERARFDGGGTPEKGGFKIGQTLPVTGMKIVNGGWYRYQWNAGQDGSMSVYVTGLEERNRHFQKVKVLEVKLAWNPLDYFDGRWGLTGTTGGAVQTAEVARVAVESPMVEPQ